MSTTNNPAREALEHHVSRAIARGEGEAITEVRTLAPRYSRGELLGHYPAKPLHEIESPRSSVRAYLVCFEDDHEAAVFRNEIRATDAGWAEIDALPER
jgi:hypothetical protein